MADIWPKAIRVAADRKSLKVEFDNDGGSYELPAEVLRVLSPSAEVKGHGPGQEVTVPGKRNVEIMSVQPSGNYAIRIGFDDLHDSGIYTWKYLRELGQNQDALFAEYEAKLAEKGLSRDQ